MIATTIAVAQNIIFTMQCDQTLKVETVSAQTLSQVSGLV